MSGEKKNSRLEKPLVMENPSEDECSFLSDEIAKERIESEETPTWFHMNLLSAIEQR